MKMTDDNFSTLSDAIREVLGPPDRAIAHRESYRSLGLSDERFRWDSLHAATVAQWISDTLYPYLNDDNIDTALRRIINELTGE